MAGGFVKHKSRTKPDLVTAGLSDKRYNNLGQLQSTISRPDVVYGSETESISYNTRPRSSRSKSNYCVHYHEKFFFAGAPSQPTILTEKPPVGGNGWYYEYINHSVQACLAKSATVDTAQTALDFRPGTGYLGGNGQSLMNLAWQDMQPDLTELSLPNFLLELDDISALFKLWKSNVSLAKNLAGLHLNYKFGWKPTIGDLTNVVDSLTGFQRKLDDWVKSLNVVVKKTKRINNSSAQASGSFDWYTSAAGSKVFWTATSERKTTAFAAYAPQPLAVISDFDKVLRGLLDSLGFEINPHIIWEAVPFSFIVDWFFNIGAWLDSFKFDALHLPVRLVDCYLQNEETLKVNWDWKRGMTDNQFYNQAQSPGCLIEQTHFQRLPILPEPVALRDIGWRMPKFGQATLLVSLATVLKR